VFARTMRMSMRRRAAGRGRRGEGMKGGRKDEAYGAGEGGRGGGARTLRNSRLKRATVATAMQVRKVGLSLEHRTRLVPARTGL
jgi:hypothetical protein